jgi:hypothetical protein
MACDEEVLHQEPTLQENILFLHLFIWVNLASDAAQQPDDLIQYLRTGGTEIYEERASGLACKRRRISL